MKYTYYILTDPYCSDAIHIKTTLPQNQLKEAVAYIALNFHDIVQKKFYCPHIIAKFLCTHYPCKKTVPDKNTTSSKLPMIDICIEKNKYLSNSYYFREYYEKKFHKSNIKNEIFDFIASQSFKNKI